MVDAKIGLKEIMSEEKGFFFCGENKAIDGEKEGQRESGKSCKGG